MPRVTEESRERARRRTARTKPARIVLRGRLRVRREADPDRALAVCVAERVRFARAKAGLSQEALARRVGIARPNVARLEAGRHLPSLSTLRRVSKALGVALGFLVTVPGPDAEDSELAEAGLAEWAQSLERHDRAR